MNLKSWRVTQNERPILVLSLLRFSKMTSELIAFYHLRCHSSSTALGTRTGYWKPTWKGTNETLLNLTEASTKEDCPFENCGSPKRGMHLIAKKESNLWHFSQYYRKIKSISIQSISPILEFWEGQLPYARHCNSRFVYFLPHFSVQFIIKRSQYYRLFKYINKERWI